jgi:hypothetical protein
MLDTILGRDWIVEFFNPNHVPAGSRKGGQFASVGNSIATPETSYSEDQAYLEAANLDQGEVEAL